MYAARERGPSGSSSTAASASASLTARWSAKRSRTISSSALPPSSAPAISSSDTRAIHERRALSGPAFLPNWEPST